MHPVLRELFLALHWFWCAFSAPVLPWMDKDARVEHRVDVGTEWILSFKVGLVHLSSCMNVIIMAFLICGRWEKSLCRISRSTISSWTIALHLYDFICDEFVTNIFLLQPLSHKILDMSTT